MAILTTDYNALQARIAKIYGTGVGEFGYGQTLNSVQLNPVIPAILSDFQKLRTDILAARYHQVGVPATPPIPVLSNLITSAIWGQFLSVMTQVEVSKLLAPHSSQATRTLISSEVTPSDTWNSTTTHTVTVQFTDEDHMRYYFNSGGSIEFSATSTNTSTNTKSNAWNTLLTSAGIISFKQNATTSTKAAGTALGFSTITNTDQQIFEKSITDNPSPNRYTITANKDISTFSINFTITFTNAGANVTAILHSTVNAFHASGIYVAVAEPDVSSDLIPGLSNPTFALSRSVNKIDEGGVAVTFTMTTSNFSDSLMYWTIIGSKITASDFDPPSLTGSFEVTNNIGTFDITAAADNFTEGLEQFNVQIRTDTNPKSPVVAQLSSLEIITDLSVTPPSPTYTFLPLSTTTVSEGESVTYKVVTTNVPDGTVLNWSTKAISPTLTADDFLDRRLTGTITIFGNNAEFVRPIANDTIIETTESYQIVLSYVNPITGVSKAVQTSELVKINDPVVVAPTIPYTVTNDVYLIPEDSTTAVTFIIRTPPLPSNTKLYWRVVTDSGLVSASDFTDNTLTGSVVISDSNGVVVRRAKKDSITEGNESFHVSFYADMLMTKWLVDSEVITIYEDVKYELLRTPASMDEAGTAGAVGFGVTFTLNTPKLQDGTVLYWTTVSEAGTVIASDFTDNAIDGTVTIMNNTGQILRRAASDNLTEGTEQFHLEIRATAGTVGPILVSSQSTSITEVVKYEIIPQTALITEGQIGVEFIVKTPYLKDGTVLYWDTLTNAGAITATDFTDNRLSGTVTITNNTGSINRAAINDTLTEGIESFYLILKTGTTIGTKVAESIPVSIAEVVAYTITPTATAFTEGQSGITFNITTPSVTNGTKIYWTTLRHAGNITPDDFIVSDAQGGAAQRLSGYAVITNNKASFILSGRSDGITEGPETFQIELRLDSITGPVQATTDLITLNEIVPYRIIPNVTSVNEGSSVSFAVTTPLLTDGTTLYWTTHTNAGTIDSTDFTDALQGTVVIKNNTGSIIRTVSADNTTEGVDAFSLELRSGSYTGSILVTSGVVTINDTSQAPVEVIPDAPTYSIIPNKTTVIEGDSVTFNIYTTNVLPAASLYWTLFKGPGLTDSSFVPSLSSSAIHIAYDNPGSADTSGHVQSGVSILTVTTTANEEDRAFIFELRTGSVAGTVVATSSVPVKVVNPTLYMIYANNRTIVEGSQTGVTFTVTTPAAAYGTNLTWTVVSDSGTVDSYDLSPGITGQVAIDSSGTGTFTLTALANAPVEGDETFHITLATAGGTPISLGTSSPIIKITENTPYLLAASPMSVDEGSPITFTFSTPKLNADTSYTWTIVGKNGTIERTDFTPATLTGTITVPSSTSSQTFTITPVDDKVTEGDEQFYIDMTLTSTGQQIVLGSPTPVVTITEVVAYTISADTYSITEGTGSITFTVTCPLLSAFTNPIVVSGTGIVAADFFEKTLTPTLSDFTGTSGKFVLTPLVTNPSKGERQFTVSINTNSLPHPQTMPITIKAPTPTALPNLPLSTGTWTLLPQDELWAMQNTLAFNWTLTTTTATTADRTIAWSAKPLVTLTPANNPVVSATLWSGTVTLAANQKSVIINIPSDTLPIPKVNPSDPFEVGYSYGLTITVNGSSVTIGDGSVVPSVFLYMLDNLSVVVDTPRKLPYNKATNKIGVTVTVPWYYPGNTVSLRAIPSQYWTDPAPFVVPTKLSIGEPPTKNYIVNGQSSKITVDYKSRVATGFIETNPNVSATSVIGHDIVLESPYTWNPLTYFLKYGDNYTDGTNSNKFSLISAEYSISVDHDKIDETPPNNVVTFTVNVPVTDVNAGKTLYWQLNGLTAASFSSIPVASKSVTSAATTFQFTVEADNTTNNGAKQFYLTASFSASTGSTIASSSVVSINDTSTGAKSTLSITNYQNLNDNNRTGVTMPLNSTSVTDYVNGYLRIPVTVNPSAANYKIKVEILSNTNASLIAAAFNINMSTETILPTDSTSQIYFVMTPVYRQDIKVSTKFQVRFTSQSDPTVYVTSKELDFIVQNTPAPPTTYTPTVTLAPANILTTDTATLTIVNGNANTSYTLAIAAAPSIRPTSGYLNSGAPTYSNTLTNGGATVQLGPWSGPGTVSVTATFADKTSKSSNEITVSAPQSNHATITIDKSLTELIANNTAKYPIAPTVDITCTLTNVSTTNTITWELIDVSTSGISTAIKVRPGAGTSASFPYLTTTTLDSSTKTSKCTISVYANIGVNLTSGTFKIKASTTDVNYPTPLLVDQTLNINFTVPEIVTPTLTVSPSNMGGLDIVLTGRASTTYLVAIDTVTGSVKANPKVMLGTFPASGKASINHMVNTALSGIFENLGNGTGRIIATFENNVVLTNNFTMILYRKYSTGVAIPSTPFPSNTYITVVAVGGGGGSGGGLDSGKWSGSSAGGGGAGGASRTVVYVTTPQLGVSYFGTGGTAGDTTLRTVVTNLNYKLGDGGNGGNTSISSNGVIVLTAFGGAGSISGDARKTVSFTTPGGAGGTSDGTGGAIWSITGGAGASGQSDPKGGPSTCPLAAGGINPSTSYGYGANSSPVKEVGVKWYKYPGFVGGDGIAAFNYFVTSGTVLADPVVIVPSAPTILTVTMTYPTFYANNPASRALGFDDSNYAGSMYWEALSIPVTTGTKVFVSFDDVGSITLYGQTNTVILTKISGINETSFVIPGPDTITKIEATYQDGSNHSGRGVYAKIKDSNSAIIWDQSYPATHYGITFD
jgi:hypothetical protein